MSEVPMLAELKELTEQKSPDQNKQKALVRPCRLPQADRADTGGVGSVTKAAFRLVERPHLSDHQMLLWRRVIQRRA